MYSLYRDGEGEPLRCHQIRKEEVQKQHCKRSVLSNFLQTWFLDLLVNSFAPLNSLSTPVDVWMTSFIFFFLFLVFVADISRQVLSRLVQLTCIADGPLHSAGQGSEPVWNQLFGILINDVVHELRLKIYNTNTMRKDHTIGEARWEIKILVSKISCVEKIFVYDTVNVMFCWWPTAIVLELSSAA